MIERRIIETDIIATTRAGAELSGYLINTVIN